MLDRKESTPPSSPAARTASRSTFPASPTSSTNTPTAPRYEEGLLLAWPLLVTKTKKNYLTIQYKNEKGEGQ